MEDIKNSKPRKKNLFISIAAGLAAMILFLAVFNNISRKNAVFYEGGGRYSAFMTTDAGISSEYSGLEIELRSDGNCTAFLGEKQEKGKWSRAGDRIEIAFGKHRFTGTMGNELLELTNDASSATISLRTDSGQTDETELPNGTWKLISITDGFSVYSDEILKKIGYDDTYINIDKDGKGRADILKGGESDIKAEGEYISYKGMLLEYTFSDDQLSVKYTDDVTLTFGRQT